MSPRRDRRDPAAASQQLRAAPPVIGDLVGKIVSRYPLEQISEAIGRRRWPDDDGPAFDLQLHLGALGHARLLGQPARQPDRQTIPPLRDLRFHRKPRYVSTPTIPWYIHCVYIRSGERIGSAGT